jgi:hypothetical protein
MKKIYSIEIISLLYFIIILLGCSSSSDSSLQGEDENGINFVTGEILMVNNEPFAKIALLNDKSLYLLDCPEDVGNILSKNQGKTAKVYYSSSSVNKESVKVLKVDKIEIINGNSND